MNINNVKTYNIPGPMLFKILKHPDQRGYFLETFKQSEFEEYLGYKVPFVQDNISLSIKNVFRGLHWQIRRPQDKLIHVIRGRVLDIILDIRIESPTFGEWIAEELESDSLFFVPKGFAHGFLCLEENTYFHYKCSDEYCKEGEKSMQLKNDMKEYLKSFVDLKSLNISDKDKTAPTFNDYKYKNPQDLFYF